MPGVEKRDWRQIDFIELGEVDPSANLVDMQGLKQSNNKAFTVVGNAQEVVEHTVRRQQSSLAIQEETVLEEWVMEYVEPIQKQQNCLQNTDKEMDVTVWVHQNSVNLGRLSGFIFKDMGKKQWNF